MNNNHVPINKIDRTFMRRTQSFKEAPSSNGSSSNGTK